MPILNHPRSPRAGFSLVEMMLAITIVGVMVAIAMPRVEGATTRLNVQGARVAVANLYARARVSAIETRRTTTLNFSGTSVWITAPMPTGGLDTVGAVTDLAAQYGVAVTASGNITILPTGLVNAGAPISVKVTKGDKSDSVVISGYGRLQ